MLSIQKIWILKFYDCWGCNTGLTKISKNKSICFFIYFLHIVSACLLTTYKYFMIVELLRLIGTLQTINEMIQYTAGLFTYWMIILDSIAYRNKFHIFWRIYQEIDNQFCSQTMLFRGYMLKFNEFFPISIFLYMMIYATNSFPDSSSVFAFLIIISICQLRIFYYLFCVEIVKCQLKIIEHDLIMMKNMLNFTGMTQQFPLMSETSPIVPFELNRFKWVRGYHHRTSELMDLLNEIFGWSQAVAVSFCFYSFATDSNWLFINYGKFSITQVAIASLWIVHSHLMIFYVFRDANNCSNLVCVR